MGSRAQHAQGAKVAGQVRARVALACVALSLSLAPGCLDIDDSPSMQAELRSAKAELVEATLEMKAATAALVEARGGNGAAVATLADSTAKQLPFGDRIPGVTKIKCKKFACTIPKNVVAAIVKDNGKLARQAKVRVSRSKGKVVGYRLDTVKEGSLPAMFGLQRGDVLERVQTVKLESSASLAQVVAKLRTAKKVTAVFKRGSKRHTIRVDIVDK